MKSCPLCNGSGLDLGNVHGVDEAEQMPPVAANAREGVEGFGAWWFVEALLHQFGIAENRSERGSKLVAHVGYKLGFLLARDLKLATLLHDLIEQACIFKRDRRLVGETLHEADDGSVELAWPPASKDERAERFVRPKQRDDERCAKAGVDHRVSQGIAGPLDEIRKLQRLALVNRLG